MKLERTRYKWSCYKQLNANTRVLHKNGYAYVLVRVHRNELHDVPDPMIFGMKGWALKSCRKIKTI